MKIFLIALCILFGLICMLLCCYIKVCLCFDDEFSYKVRFLFYTCISNNKKKSRHLLRHANKSDNKASKIKELLNGKGVKVFLHFLKTVTKVAPKVLLKVLRVMTVDRFDLRVVVASDDAHDTAIQYGIICSVIGPAVSFLEQRTKKFSSSVNVNINFLQTKSKVSFVSEFRVRLVTLSIILLGDMIKFIIKKNKGECV